MKDRLSMHLQDCWFLKQVSQLRVVCFPGAWFQGKINVVGFSESKAVWNKSGDKFSWSLMAQLAERWYLRGYESNRVSNVNQCSDLSYVTVQVAFFQKIPVSAVNTRMSIPYGIQYLILRFFARAVCPRRNTAKGERSKRQLRDLYQLFWYQIFVFHLPIDTASQFLK